MMNDRFSADLRKHLLSTADERPADGQLAAVVERVAVTGQRRPFVARLTWAPGRIGPFPSAALRYGLMAVALALATVVAAVLIAASTQPPSTVFEGTWTSIDPGDGSTQTLAVSQGYTPAVRFTDSFATGEACFDDAVKVFTAEGYGTAVGNSMAVEWPTGGGCGSAIVRMDDGTYTYDKATETIVDGQQLTWRRVQGAVALSTRVPGPRPTRLPEAPPAPGSQTCFDLPAGFTYSRDVGPLSLTVTIPSPAAFGWQGYRDGFEVAGSCWFGRPVVMHASIVTTVVAACDMDATVEVGTPAEVVAALADAPGFAISEPTSVTLGGHAATRIEVPSDARKCFDEVVLWNDVTVRRGTTTIVYLVDVDGLPLGITIDNREDEAPAARMAEAEAILASLQIGIVPGPHPSSAPAPTPDPGCIQFKGTGTYKAPVGPMSLKVTLPDEPDTYWHGLRNSFYLLRAPCLFGGPLTFEASMVSQVYADACHWFETGTEVADTKAAAAALAEQDGTDVTGQAELRIDGYRAVRLGVSVPEDFDSESCAGGQLRLWQTPVEPLENIGPGLTWTVYLVDVEGSILAITERHDPGDEVESPGLLGEIDAIIGSLQIQP